MILQIRDRELLKTCYEHQFIELETAKLLFKNESYNSVSKRFTLLHKNGFLTKHQTRLLSGKFYYRTTKLGSLIARESGARFVEQPQKLHHFTLNHDSLVAAVRLKLLQLWDAEFIPEGVLRSENAAQIPDGVFVFKSGFKIALEVENSEKGRERFLGLVRRWDEIKDIGFVLYVSTSETLYKIVEDRIRAARPVKPVGVVNWNELKVGAPLVSTLKGLVPLFERRGF